MDTTLITRDRGLIGREHELSELALVGASARSGHPQLFLLAGEAGVGKTALAEAALAQSGLLVLAGISLQEATPPYGPIVAVLRAYLRLVPDGLARDAPLAGYLASLLPELGPARQGGDRATLFEAIRRAIETIARRQPVALLLDDLHWADATTLEMLPMLAGTLTTEPLLILGTFRSDDIPRAHPLRRMRTELRRAGRLHELAIDPLDREGTALLATRALGHAPGPMLAAALYHRTQGVPYFIEQLAETLAASGRLRMTATGVELAPDEQVPIPETLRDAVLLRLAGLSAQAQRALEVAAVAGLRFDLALVANLTGEEQGLEDALQHGLIVEAESGWAAFRHPLTREALYAMLAWTRRRALHRQIAALLHADGAPPAMLAEHWLAARDLERARPALLASAEASCLVHAYRDAARALRRALELWPEDEDEQGRIAALDRLGQCAELSGDLAEAARCWHEVAEARRGARDSMGIAEAERRLATVYELRGAWEQALIARQAAADAFASSGQPANAASECLAAAAHLQLAGSYSSALELIARAARAAEACGRQDLRIAALSLEGVCRAKLGQYEAGLEQARAALALALERNLIGPAAEAYHLLAIALEHAADYQRARDANRDAANFCQAHDELIPAQLCRSCLAIVLRQTGEWEHAMTLCRDILANAAATPIARTAATTILGLTFALRGDTARARAPLLEGAAAARRIELFSMELTGEWGLALLDDQRGAGASATDRCRHVLRRWEQSEERHYVIPVVRWAATCFAAQIAAAETRACAQVLAQIASTIGTWEALSALAHALGEVALLDDDARQAAQHFEQALELGRPSELPFDYAQTLLRVGVAHVAAGARDAGIARLGECYRLARKLGARPLATSASQQLAALGEPVERHLGKRAASQLQSGGLSPRELEVIRGIAVGRTNREIGHDLVLSTRTVDMHVSNVLHKLGCRSRAEAIHRASELGLL